MNNELLMQNGEYPSIMNNGRRARDNETFVTNQETLNMFLWRLLDIAMSVFKWSGLPKGVDERMLEWWLLRDGFAGFFYDEDLKNDAKQRAPEGYAVLPMLISGQWDIYEYPKDRTAYAVNGFNYHCTDENSVLIYNNYLRVPMWSTIYQFAKRLADIQRTIDINTRQQRTARIILCDDKQKLSLVNAAKEVDEGKDWITGYKNLDMTAFQVLDVTTPYVANELQIYKRQIWNEALTYLGIENNSTDKKERLVSYEVMSNMGDVEAERFTRLNARRHACNEINEIFGLNVDVEFRSGMYIRSGNSFVATRGFEEGQQIGDDYE